MGTLTEVPADVEVPLDDVCSALHEFLRTGGRPAAVVVEEASAG